MPKRKLDLFEWRMAEMCEPRERTSQIVWTYRKRKLISIGFHDIEDGLWRDSATVYSAVAADGAE